MGRKAAQGSACTWRSYHVWAWKCRGAASATVNKKKNGVSAAPQPAAVTQIETDRITIDTN